MADKLRLWGLELINRSVKDLPYLSLKVGWFSLMCFPFEVTHHPVHGGETIFNLPGSNQLPGSLAMVIRHGDGIWLNIKLHISSAVT